MTFPRLIAVVVASLIAGTSVHALGFAEHSVLMPRIAELARTRGEPEPVLQSCDGNPHEGCFFRAGEVTIGTFRLGDDVAEIVTNCDAEAPGACERRWIWAEIALEASLGGGNTGEAEAFMGRARSVPECEELEERLRNLTLILTRPCSVGRPGGWMLTVELAGFRELLALQP